MMHEDTFIFQGIMLVYDITNEKSFDNIRNWIRNIEEVSQHFLFLMDRIISQYGLAVYEGCPGSSQNFAFTLYDRYIQIHNLYHDKLQFNSFKIGKN